MKLKFIKYEEGCNREQILNSIKEPITIWKGGSSMIFINNEPSFRVCSKDMEMFLDYEIQRASLEALLP